MTVLIDSWAWIEYWKGSKSGKIAATYIDGDEEVFVSTINLTETYVWVARNYDEEIARHKIEAIEKRAYIVPVEKGIALEAARLKLKHKLGIADAVVLATANHIKGNVVTGDPDFKNIDKVTFIGE